MGCVAHRWEARRYGDLDGLELVEVEVDPPEPGPGRGDDRGPRGRHEPGRLQGGARGQRPSRAPAAGRLRGRRRDHRRSGRTPRSAPAGEVGDEVLAFRIAGGYASAVTVPAKDVFAKPAALDFPEAANLLLVGATAADMLRRVPVGAARRCSCTARPAASGSASCSRLGCSACARSAPPASAASTTVRRFGGVPVAYGAGPGRPGPRGGTRRRRRRARHGRHRRGGRRLAGAGRDRRRSSRSPRPGAREDDGFRAVGGRQPDSTAFRDRRPAG